MPVPYGRYSPLLMHLGLPRIDARVVLFPVDAGDVIERIALDTATPT